MFGSNWQFAKTIVLACSILVSSSLNAAEYLIFKAQTLNDQGIDALVEIPHCDLIPAHALYFKCMSIYYENDQTLVYQNAIKSCQTLEDFTNTSSVNLENIYQAETSNVGSLDDIANALFSDDSRAVLFFDAGASMLSRVEDAACMRNTGGRSSPPPPPPPPLDSDGDGIPDSSDNCPAHSNPTQVDSDGDGIGDACEPPPPPPPLDSDGDGIPDNSDNCPVHINPGQEDSDGDGIGDACEPPPPPPPLDSDGDGIPDNSDNCPVHINPGQEDSDGDGIGDACEPPPPPPPLDSDGDGIPDNSDNCPVHINPGQEDSDGDGIGDACEPPPPPPPLDSDGDGIPDNSDNCPVHINPGQEDSDGNGIGDACEPVINPVIVLDIKPDSDQNSINPRSNGVIPVAVLSSSTFDATLINVSTVVFGIDEASPAHNGHQEDANGDGMVDMVFHFRTQATGVACGDTEMSLTAETLQAEQLTVTDSIETVGCKDSTIPPEVATDEEIAGVEEEEDEDDNGSTGAFMGWYLLILATIALYRLLHLFLGSRRKLIT